MNRPPVYPNGRPDLTERLRQHLEGYFLPKVLRREGCWIWIGPINGTGRGQSSYPGYATKTRTNKGTTTAPRAAYMYFIAPIPDGMCVCHDCDEPLCVNPYHLFLGSSADNFQDMVRKGRAWFQKQTRVFDKGASLPVGLQ